MQPTGITINACTQSITNGYGFAFFQSDPAPGKHPLDVSVPGHGAPHVIPPKDSHEPGAEHMGHPASKPTPAPVSGTATAKIAPLPTAHQSSTTTGGKTATPAPVSHG